MFKSAMLTDLKPSEFWDMTIKEYYIYSECHYNKKNEQSEFDIKVAWYFALFNNGKLCINDVIKKEEKINTEQDNFNAMQRLFLGQKGV